MQQKLILENWRKFLKEVNVSPTTSNKEVSPQTQQQSANTQQLDVRKPTDIKNMILATAKGQAGSAGPDQITKQNIQKNNKVLDSTRSVTQPIQSAELLIQVFKQLSPEDQAEAAKVAQAIMQTSPQQNTQKNQKVVNENVVTNVSLNALAALGGGDISKGMQRLGAGAFIGAIGLGLAQIATGDIVGGTGIALNTLVKSMQKLYSSNNIADLNDVLSSIGGTALDAIAPEGFVGKRSTDTIEEAKKKRAKVVKKKSGDRCTRIAKRKYDVWPSAYASGAVVKCRQGKIWKGVSENASDQEIDDALLLEEIEVLEEQNNQLNERCWKGYTQKGMKTMFGKRYPNCVKVTKESVDVEETNTLEEKWSGKYKRSIDCKNPKGFSQKAHCQGKKKNEDIDLGEVEIIEEAKKKDYKPNFSKEKEQGLHGWFARNDGKGWVNCRTGGPCGRDSADKGGKYPACRPTKAQCKSAGKGPLRKKKSSSPISWTKKKKKD